MIWPLVLIAFVVCVLLGATVFAMLTEVSPISEAANDEQQCRRLREMGWTESEIRKFMHHAGGHYFEE